MTTVFLLAVKHGWEGYHIHDFRENYIIQHHSLGLLLHNHKLPQVPSAIRLVEANFNQKETNVNTLKSRTLKKGKLSLIR